MHASYQIIIQVLQLAYTTQACIFEFENLCNASKHMNMHISNAINQSSWACSPYLCASLVQEFWSISFLQCCSLFAHVHVQPLFLLYLISPIVQSLPHSIKLSYLCIISPPLSSISIKGKLLIDAKVCIWGRWLRLESCIFYGHHLIVGMTSLVTCITCILCRASWNTTHRIFSWYQFVVHLPLCDSMGHPFDTLELL